MHRNNSIIHLIQSAVSVASMRRLRLCRTQSVPAHNPVASVLRTGEPRRGRTPAQTAPEPSSEATRRFPVASVLRTGEPRRGRRAAQTTPEPSSEATAQNRPSSAFKTAIACLSLILPTISFAEVSVSAVFNPPRIMLGDKARYVVEIKETSDTSKPSMEEVNSLPIPRSGGLQLSNGRTSVGGQQLRVINGVAEYSVSQQLIIDANASNIGTYTLPSYTIQYKGETLRVPAATLEVVERSANAAPPTDELLFLQIETPEQLYVGQTTNIELKMYISEQVRFGSLNRFDRSADSFTITDLPDSRESTEVYNGRRYRVLTWPFTLTPIQTGRQDLSFQFTVTAQLPGQNNRRDPFGSIFGRSMIDDMFGRGERINLFTEPTQIEVQPLPTADQPASFTGAIGDFGLQVYTDRETTVQGEPIMLSIEVAGEGNFDRINGPILAETTQWRSYEPESKFTPSNTGNNLRGTKRFDYVMIPNEAGRLTLPEAAFAYFDPMAKRYIEMKAPPIEIEVSPSNNPSAPVVPASGNTPQTTEIIAQPIQQELSIEEALLTLDYTREEGTESQGGQPILRTPLFWIGNLTATVALGALCLILKRKRRLAEDPDFAAQEAAKKALAQARKAAHSAQDSETFYAEAQRAVRLAASVRAGKNLNSATAADICNGDINEKAANDIQALFDAADAQRFSQNERSDNLSAAKTNLERILKAL